MPYVLKGTIPIAYGTPRTCCPPYMYQPVLNTSPRASGTPVTCGPPSGRWSATGRALGTVGGTQLVKPSCCRLHPQCHLETAISSYRHINLHVIFKKQAMMKIKESQLAQEKSMGMKVHHN